MSASTSNLSLDITEMEAAQMPKHIQDLSEKFLEFGNGLSYADFKKALALTFKYLDSTILSLPKKQ